MPASDQCGVPQDAASRTVLLLQGPPSALWADLANALGARGARVLRVELCLGDRLFWRGPALRYRGGLRGWRHWLEALVRREGIDSIVYYADRQPYHRIARMVARRTGAVACAMEFGYLRPDWVTLERDGTGARSRFLAEASALLPDPALPDMTVRHAHAFWQEALGEVSFNLVNSLLWPMHPRYAADKSFHPVADYLLWLPKLALGPWRERQARRDQARLVAPGGRFWLLALQMPGDYMLRASAVITDQRAMVTRVLASFAAHAAPQERLAIKLHPFDNGWNRWRRRIARQARRLGIADRVDVLDGGDLGLLLRHARGVVVTNSTVGLHGLRAGRPVVTLGVSVYDMPGLTHQGSLDAFWTGASPPDADLLRRFLGTLAAEIQIKGSVYDRAGRLRAAAGMAERIAAGTVGPSLRGPDPAPLLARLRRFKPRQLGAG